MSNAYLAKIEHEERPATTLGHTSSEDGYFLRKQSTPTSSDENIQKFRTYTADGHEQRSYSSSIQDTRMTT